MRERWRRNKAYTNKSSKKKLKVKKNFISPVDDAPKNVSMGRNSARAMRKSAEKTEILREIITSLPWINWVVWCYHLGQLVIICISSSLSASLLFSLFVQHLFAMRVYLNIRFPNIKRALRFSHIVDTFTYHFSYIVYNLDKSAFLAANKCSSEKTNCRDMRTVYNTVVFCSVVQIIVVVQILNRFILLMAENVRKNVEREAGEIERRNRIYR